jgi:hypothetical protein
MLQRTALFRRAGFKPAPCLFDNARCHAVPCEGALGTIDGVAWVVAVLPGGRAMVGAIEWPERTHEYRNHHLDSTRWDRFTARDDDIFVTTAYKAGTTWVQRIVAALVFGGAPLPGRLGEISPWIDARYMGPVEPVLAAVEAQRHRRFIKSHLAADGLRFFPQAKYVVVGRDTRDVFMSLHNH